MAARLAVHRGDRAGAAVQLAAADRLLPQLTHALPWLADPDRLELTRVELAIGGHEPAAAHMKEVRELLRRRPDLGLLVQRVRELEQAARPRRRGFGLGGTLTGVELRLLPLLTTHPQLPRDRG